MLSLFAFLTASPGGTTAVPGLWEWITTTTTVDGVLNTLGATGLAILFATDRIMTKGGHERRVKDLSDFHARELATIENANRDRIDGLVASRAEYKAAYEAERERADRATATLGDFAEVVELIPKVLAELTPKGGTT